MPEDREALLQHYRTTRAALLAAIDGLSDEQMTDPSLDGWSVKDHLSHIAVWDEVRAAEVARISAGYDSAWRMDGEQDEAYNTLSHNLRSDLSPAQVRWELETTRAHLLDAIASATPRGLEAVRYGEAGLHSDHEATHTPWIKRWRAAKGM